MPSLLAETDLAIIAGGTTTWEIAFMGLPAAVVSLADNQRPVDAAAAAAGIAIDLGWHADLEVGKLAAGLRDLHADHPRRLRMAQAGQQLIDGQGVERVRQHLLGERLRLRRARRQDAELLWNWTNDPEVRSRSFQPAPIPWEDHLRWLDAKLRDPDSFVFLGVDEEDMPVGQVRLDVSGPGKAVISVSVCRERRGGGWGTELIASATRWGQSAQRLHCIHAWIKPDNAASLHAFAKAGYRIVGLKQRGGMPTVHAVAEVSAGSCRAA
jgi:RimJ/RimL family protein N-acetyltransferase